jgi:hypothetical protein
MLNDHGICSFLNGFGYFLQIGIPWLLFVSVAKISLMWLVLFAVVFFYYIKKQREINKLP